jgi:hypothetical protein
MLELGFEERLDRVGEILADRGKTYGDSDSQYAALAARWSTVLGIPISPAQALMMLIDMKLVRAFNGAPNRDTIDDIVGYACVLGKTLKV